MRKVCILAVLILSLMIAGCGSEVTNEKAVVEKKDRILMIINNTDQTINKIEITVGDGIEVYTKENPDEKNINVKIHDNYKNYDEFTITFTDRYGYVYQKVVSDVKEKGSREISITEDDKVSQEGDWKRNIDKIFNGD